VGHQDERFSPGLRSEIDGQFRRLRQKETTMTHKEAVAFAKELRRQKNEISQREKQTTRQSLYGLAIIAVILAGLGHAVSLAYQYQTEAGQTQIAAAR
jgi:hypothetical protein